LAFTILRSYLRSSHPDFYIDFCTLPKLQNLTYILPSKSRLAWQSNQRNIPFLKYHRVVCLDTLHSTFVPIYVLMVRRSCWIENLTNSPLLYFVFHIARHDRIQIYRVIASSSCIALLIICKPFPCHIRTNFGDKETDYSLFEINLNQF